MSTIRFRYNYTNYRQEKAWDGGPIDDSNAFETLQWVCPAIISEAHITNSMTLEQINSKLRSYGIKYSALNRGATSLDMPDEIEALLTDEDMLDIAVEMAARKEEEVEKQASKQNRRNKFKKKLGSKNRAGLRSTIRKHAAPVA